MKPEIIKACFQDMKRLIEHHHGKYGLDGMDTIKEWWAESKAHLFPYFDEHGRREIFLPTDSLTSEDYRSALSDTMNATYEMVCRRGTDEKPNRFRNVEYSRLGMFLGTTLGNFSCSEIANNAVARDREFNDLRITKGMKVTKVINKAAKMFDFGGYGSKEMLELIDIAASMLVGRLKKSWTVCLSINPLDFMLASAHTTGWRSCHNFVNGEYCAGWLPYMLDEVTLIGFAYGKKEMVSTATSEFCSFNSSLTEQAVPVKRWRSMVFLDIDNKNAVIGREYPDSNSAFHKTLRKLAARTLADITGSPRAWWVRKYASAGGEEELDTDESSFRVRNETEFSYSDTPSSAIRLKNGGEYSIIYACSEVIPCLDCGEERTDSYYDRLFCRYCDDGYEVCANCEERCSGESFTGPNGGSYCENCYHENFFVCDKCYDIIDNDERVGIEGCDVYVCETCAERHYYYCDKCETWHYETYYVSDEEEDWCQGCIDEYAISCAECGELFRDYEHFDGDYFCRDCLDDITVGCEDCGETVRRDECMELFDKMLCENCYDKYPICDECLEKIEEGEYCEECEKEKEAVA